MMKWMRNKALAGTAFLVLGACAHEYPPIRGTSDSGPDIPIGDEVALPSPPAPMPVEDASGAPREQAGQAAERAAQVEARRLQAAEAAGIERKRQLRMKEEGQRLAENEDRRRHVEEESQRAAEAAAASEPTAGEPAQVLPEGNMSGSGESAANEEDTPSAAPSYARRATASPMQPGQTGVVVLAVSYELDGGGLQQWLELRYPDLSTHATVADRDAGGTGAIADAPHGRFRYLSARLRCLQLDCPTEDETVYREVIEAVPMLWQWSFAVPSEDSFRQGQIEIDLFGAQAPDGELQPLNPIPKVDIRFEIRVEPPTLFERIMPFLSGTEKILGVIAAIIGIIVGIVVSLRKLRSRSVEQLTG